MSYYDEEYYDNDLDVYHFEYKHETDDAILVTDWDSKEIWLPKSQIDYDDMNYKKGDEIEITIPEWLAKDKGFF